MTDPQALQLPVTARFLRAERQRSVVTTPHGGYLYIKHLPRRVKRAVKKGVMRRALRTREYQAVDQYLRREGTRDQSHRFKMPKAKWGPGPWHDEPDYIDFAHAGLECVVMRNLWVTGTLNGYVGVPPSHPWWGKDCSECLATPPCNPDIPPDFDEWAKMGMPVPPEGSRMRAVMQEMQWSCPHRVAALVRVHDGVNFSAGAIEQTPKRKHQDLWWFGFDTSHAGDHSPMMEATLKECYTHRDPTGQEWARHQGIMQDYETYRELPYVRHEVEQLAEQLAMAAQVQA